jgi:spore germination protein
MKSSRKLGLVLLLTLLTGCRDEFILEQLGFTRAVAYDVANKDTNVNDLLKITFSISKANENENERILLSTVARTSKEARITFTRQNNRRIVTGQLRSVLFGTTLAKQGLWKHVDTLFRDPSIGSKVNVLLVDGNANDFLERNYKQYPSTGTYIDSLIRTAAKTFDVPDVTLYSFTRDYFDDGIDAIAPILKEGPETITLSGIGLFNQDKYVMRIEPKQMMLFAFIRDRLISGETYFDVSEEQDEHELAMLSSISSKRNIKVSHEKRPTTDGTSIKVNINLDLYGSLLEYTGKLNLQEDRNQVLLENQINAYIEKETTAMIKNMQKYKTDPIGIGQYVRNSMTYAEWSKLEWDEAFANIDVKVHAKMHIKNTGKLQE